MIPIPFGMYLAGFILISIIRGYYTFRYKDEAKVIPGRNRGDSLLLGLTGISMFLPFVFQFSSWLDFADYHLPLGVSIAGFLIFLYACWLLYRSHSDLGRNWSSRPAINKDHELITRGVYSKIRHPMYAAHLCWGLAQILLIHNWIAGFSLYFFTLLLYLNRVNREEKLLLKQFGKEYADYARKTGRILPLFKTFNFPTVLI